MIKNPSTLFLSIAIFCTAFMFQTAHAEQASANAPRPLAIQLPEVDREALIEDLRTLRSQLIVRKQMLVLRVEDQKLDRSDALITAIMPGGLLYAGYKKARHEQTKSELAAVVADIEDLSGDLLAVQSWSTPAVVAQLR